MFPGPVVLRRSSAVFFCGDPAPFCGNPAPFCGDVAGPFCGDSAPFCGDPAPFCGDFRAAAEILAGVTSGVAGIPVAFVRNLQQFRGMCRGISCFIAKKKQKRGGALGLRAAL